MKYIVLNELIRILTLNPYDPRDAPDSNDLRGIKGHINKLLFDFFEECRTNLKTGDIESNLLLINSLQDKFNHIKNQNFKTIDSKLIHRPSGNELEAEKNENISSTLSAQYECINSALKHLFKLDLFYKRRVEKQTKPQKKDNKRVRQLTYPSFQSHLTPKNLEDISRNLEDISRFMKKGFIHKSTDPKIFIGIFSGENPKKKIIWEGSQQELKLFIKGINDVGIKDISGEIWKVTSNCFTKSNGEGFLPSKLKDAGKPENPERTEKLINYFNDLAESD